MLVVLLLVFCPPPSHSPPRCSSHFMMFLLLFRFFRVGHCRVRFVFGLGRVFNYIQPFLRGLPPNPDHRSPPQEIPLQVLTSGQACSAGSPIGTPLTFSLRAAGRGQSSPRIQHPFAGKMSWGGTPGHFSHCTHSQCNSAQNVWISLALSSLRSCCESVRVPPLTGKGFHCT